MGLGWLAATNWGLLVMVLKIFFSLGFCSGSSRCWQLGLLFSFFDEFNDNGIWLVIGLVFVIFLCLLAAPVAE